MLWLTETNNMAVILSHTAQTENFIMTRNNHHRQQQKSSKLGLTNMDHQP